MRWYLISSIVTDSRILILLAILIIFIIIAVGIVIFELKLKKRTTKKFTEKVEDIRLVSFKGQLQKAKNITEKLAIIDKQAKSLFKERFHLSHKKSYSELIEAFNEKQKYNYTVFCEKMFEAYYSDEGVSEDKLRNLILLLTRLIREKGTSIDPERYAMSNLYPTPQEEAEHKHTRINKVEKKQIIQLEKQKNQFFKKQQHLIEKQMSLTEKQKEMKKTEKKMRKREKINQRILKKVETKLKEQERRLKQEETLQHKIAKDLEKEENQKNRIKDTIKHKKMLEQKRAQEKTKKHWRDEIEINAPRGKDWLKEHKTKRSK